METQLTLFSNPNRKAHHNTTGLSGNKLVQRNHDANKQDAYVLSLFELYKNLTFTAWEMYELIQLSGRTMPKESVKRAMTNLKNDGKLVKTLERRPGQYPGISNAAYKLK